MALEHAQIAYRGLEPCYSSKRRVCSPDGLPRPLHFDHCIATIVFQPLYCNHCIVTIALQPLHCNHCITTTAAEELLPGPDAYFSMSLSVRYVAHRVGLGLTFVLKSRWLDEACKELLEQYEIHMLDSSSYCMRHSWVTQFGAFSLSQPVAHIRSQSP